MSKTSARDHRSRAWSAVELVGGGAEFRRGLGIERDDLQAARLSSASTDSASCAGASARTRFSSACAAAVTSALSSALMRFQAALEMIIAPVSGAMCEIEHVLRVAEDLQRQREVRRVRRRVDQAGRELQLRGMSAGSSATG